MSELIWHGHSTLEIRTELGTKVLIDPWFNGNPVTKDKDVPKEVDLILLTHDHPDHTGDTVSISNDSGAKVVAQPETLRKFVSDGMKDENGLKLNIGGSLTYKDVKVTMVHAFHTATTGVPAGLIIEVDGKVIYNLGDTGMFSDMQLFGSFYQVDLAIIPVGGIFTMDYVQGAEAARLVSAPHVLPVHYGTFPGLLDDVNLYVQEVNQKDPDVKVHGIKVGESIKFNQLS